MIKSAAPAETKPLLAQYLPLYPARQLPISLAAVQQVKLDSLLARPVYRVVYPDQARLFDANSGDEVVIDKQLAERIARDSYGGAGELISSHRLDQGSE